MRHCRFALLSILLLVPGLAGAQDLEISLLGGYRGGGELEGDENALFDEDVDIDGSGTYGARLGVHINRSFQIELMASRQESEFEVDEELFGEDRALLDVELDYYHVGILWQSHAGQVQPYGVVSLGIGRISPDLPTIDDEERLSASVGGGVKILMNRHVGFRFEGRLFWTDISEEDDDFGDNCCDLDYGDDLYQGEVTAGLTFVF